MKTETLKIKVAQRVLGITDNRLLQKIQDVLDEENCFAYDADGHPVSKADYIESINVLNKDIDNGTAELHSTNDVLKRIANDHKLAL